MVLENTLLLKKNRVEKKSKNQSMVSGKMGKEFSGSLMKWSNQLNEKQ